MALEDSVDGRLKANFCDSGKCRDVGWIVLTFLTLRLYMPPYMSQILGYSWR